MIRINQLKLPVRHTEEELREKILRTLRIRPGQLISYRILKQSLDARKKEEIRWSYVIEAEVQPGVRIRTDGKNILLADRPVYHWPEPEDGGPKRKIIIAGCGPAGLFAGLALARAGLKPLLIDRGEDAVSRKKTVERFWETGALDPMSNVSFGEGGAGTFSDGKLATLVRDESGRNTAVLETFVRFGANPAILYQQKPHIGTDCLIGIITALRREIESLGGEVRFRTQMTDLMIKDGRLTGIRVRTPEGNMDELSCDGLVLAIGHSARDTFAMLEQRQLILQPKAFAVGLRIQHPQQMIDRSQFGPEEAEYLSPASYKLTARASGGRSVYSFCMCPGGYVVNASTEAGRTAVNGMSYHARSSPSANAALAVTVTPEDFPDGSVLSGVEFQRRLEEAAWKAAEGGIPVQLLGDYLQGNESHGWGDTVPCFRGKTAFARLDRIFPDFLRESIAGVMPEFERKIRGYSRPDAILAGIETRTSSPVRILRDESYLSNIEGIYPCGEGAGYAGGITSAAMDGLRTAEKILEQLPGRSS